MGTYPCNAAIFIKSNNFLWLPVYFLGQTIRPKNQLKWEKFVPRGANSYLLRTESIKIGGENEITCGVVSSIRAHFR